MSSSHRTDLPPGNGESAPDVEEVVIDVIDEHDETVPPEFRGCQVVELRTEHGSVLIYKGKGGFTASEEQAKILIQAYRLEKESEEEAAKAAPAVTPGGQPGKVASVETPIRGDLVLRVLGYGSDVPEKLQGSRLIQRGTARFFLTLDGEAIPEDVGKDLLDSWEPPGRRQFPETSNVDAPKPSLSDADMAVGLGADGGEDSVLEGEPTVTDGGEDLRARILELAAQQEAAPVESGEDSPPPKATGDSEEAVSGVDGERPDEVLDEDDTVTAVDQGEDGPTIPASAAALAAASKKSPGLLPIEPKEGTAEEPLAEQPKEDAGPPADVSDEDESVGGDHEQPGASIPDDGSAGAKKPRETGRETKAGEGSGAAVAASLPAVRTSRVAGSESGASLPKRSQEESHGKPSDGQGAGSPAQEPVTYSEQELEAARESLNEKAEILRRDLATSVLKLDQHAPRVEELEVAFWNAVAKTPDRNLERLVRRSLEISDRILSAWQDSDERRERSWSQDMTSGTLVLCAINPLQAAQTDFFGLVSLIRLRSNRAAAERRVSRSLDKVRREAATSLGKTLMSRSWIKDVTEFVVARMSQGRREASVLTEWMRARLVDVLQGALVQMQDSDGISFPGLLEAMVDAHEPLVVLLVEHLLGEASS